MPDAILLSCEHASNFIPSEYRGLFKGGKKIFTTHRAYDIGAAELAQRLRRRLRCPLYAGTHSRLLIDLNRTFKSRSLFSSFTRGLPQCAKQIILKRYHTPYYEKMFRSVKKLTVRHKQVFHLSVHSFTPALNGTVRQADLGILYDPARRSERVFSALWKEAAGAAAPDLRVRFNYPYKGTMDGMTTYLRKCFPGRAYCGIELEINQKFAQGNRREWVRLQNAIEDSFCLAMAWFKQRRRK